MFKALDLWLPAYLRRSRGEQASGIRHVLLCVCDHFEPFHGTDKTGALARMAIWRREFPKLADEFRDADGQPPRQTFFYPIEQYDADVISELSALCKETRCETEIHLHHDNDSAENLRRVIELGKENFARHGLLSRDESGALRYGFVHGNWALDNSHPQGRHCGVRNELAILRGTGCYADFTMPSAPSSTQTRTINSLYYAAGTSAPKSHDRGVPARVGAKASGDLLLVQGPLGLNWRRRKFGVLPRIENADLTAANPPTSARLQVWLRMNIHVVDRDEWIFVKLHTHGGIERNSAMLLGEPMKHFHRQLASVAGGDLRFHYVSAREMVNILHAAEEGHAGDPGAFRDHRYRSNIVRIV
jgi:hypothetical protein